MLAFWVLNYTFCQKTGIMTRNLINLRKDARCSESWVCRFKKYISALRLRPDKTNIFFKLWNCAIESCDYWLCSILTSVVTANTDRSHQQLQFLSSLPLSGCPQPSPSSPSECSYQWQQWLYYSKYFPSLWYHEPSITMNFARKRIRSFLNSSGSGMIGSRPGFIRSQYKI